MRSRSPGPADARRGLPIDHHVPHPEANDLETYRPPTPAVTSLQTLDRRKPTFSFQDRHFRAFNRRNSTPHIRHESTGRRPSNMHQLQ